MSKKPITLVAAVLFGILAACGEDPSPDDGGLSGEITVIADSSLREAFTELGSELQDRHPKAEVQFEFAPSSEIDEKVTDGDEADVVAVSGQLDSALRSKVDRAPVFARSRLAIYVAAGNPQGIQGPADLARPTIEVALCEKSTPCGAAGGDALSLAGVVPPAASTHAGGQAAVRQVSEGKADAAVVLQTDVAPGDTTVERIDFDDQHAVILAYSVARSRSSDNEPLARGFVSFALSGEGQEVLRSFGFGPP